MLRRILPVLLPAGMLLGGASIALVALLLASAWHVADSIDAQAQEVENIALFPGCNPVAITQPDNTPIETIADAVSPPEILISLWKFDEPTVKWLGYSPVAPARASDLTQTNLLDAVFICVNAVGTFTRPVI